MSKDIKGNMKFGNHIISNNQIFYLRKFVFGFVNIRPFLPGHVLLAPVRQEKKFSDLTETEAMEMWISAKNIAQNLKKFYHVESVQISIQDGEDSGQTVDHCHIHIIPIPAKYSPNKIDDLSKKNRTSEEMAQEAEDYKENFVFN